MLIKAQEEIRKFYNELRKDRKDDPTCYCHEKFDIDDLNHPQYAWQWNFSIGEYNRIKALLKNHAAVLKDVIRNDKTCCKLLQLYVSEWYKRNYNGNDR